MLVESPSVTTPGVFYVLVLKVDCPATTCQRHCSAVKMQQQEGREQLLAP